MLLMQCDVVARLDQVRVQKGIKRGKQTIIENLNHKNKKKKRSRNATHDRLIICKKPKTNPVSISQKDCDSSAKDFDLNINSGLYFYFKFYN